MTAESGVIVPHTDADGGRHGDGHGTGAGVTSHERGIDTALLGIMLFIGSEIMFFGGLFAAYFNVKASAPVWPPEGIDFIEFLPLPLIVTIILVVSSFTMQYAVGRIAAGDRTGLIRGLAVTLLLGVIFLFLQFYDYSVLLLNDHFGIDSGVYGSLFYTMTGFHGAHVFGGVVGITVILIRAMQGQFSARHHVAVEAVSAYWHFVDVVWIALVLTIYVLK
ncbi:MAG: cytochrome c oxidase subunit 3 [Candidatus Limnocylindrales bacterium]